MCQRFRVLGEELTSVLAGAQSGAEWAWARLYESVAGQVVGSSGRVTTVRRRLVLGGLMSSVAAKVLLGTVAAMAATGGRLLPMCSPNPVQAVVADAAAAVGINLPSPDDGPVVGDDLDETETRLDPAMDDDQGEDNDDQGDAVSDVDGDADDQGDDEPAVADGADDQGDNPTDVDGDDQGERGDSESDIVGGTDDHGDDDDDGDDGDDDDGDDD